MRDRRVPGRLGDHAIFLNHQRDRVQVAGEKMGSGEVVECELQVRESACAAGELGLLSCQGMPGLEAPQLKRNDLADSSAGEPEPVARLVGTDVKSEDELDCPGQFQRGRCMPLDQPDRECI
jgi:hypothetical protein